ncbi:ogr/Delta-like zinc finger family protein [Vibrio coralliilyticus]|uniref:ogr/Delta-like zinc finger family protein n=1 Tax=Vibrio coralliilyticus TaxID=190893 RepID=UPI00148E0242|nr:hypothetical protein [Vibrio coralliilyticus]NOI51229.1 hypothetical protein [Vibrio coralliilyticus]
MSQKIKCPKCGSATKVITSRPMTAAMREAYMRCTDPDCGTGVVCFIYPNKVISKGSDIRPPDQTVQPKLFEQRARILKKLDITTNIEASHADSYQE